MKNVTTRRKRQVGYLAAIGGVGIVTLILAPFNTYINATTAALALLIVVLASATVFGSRPALAGSLVAVLSFNFFFLPPFYTFTIADPQNWVAFASFLVTALVAGQLSSYARRRAEEAERLYAKLEEAFEKASAAEALRRSDQLKSALLDAVTHDLRTPLTAIKAAATTLIEDAGDTKANGAAFHLDDPGRREFLHIIDEETDRLNTFIGGMVDIARVEAGGLQNRKTWVTTEELVENSLERAKPRIAGHQIVTDVEPDVTLLTDATALAEVLYALIDNAAKYTRPGLKIRISAGRSISGKVRFSVEDQGKGISESMREKVFQKFTRDADDDLHTTGSGLGLGLSISKAIVESQKGRIWIVGGRDGYVTNVIFEIPVGDEDEKIDKHDGFA